MKHCRWQALVLRQLAHRGERRLCRQRHDEVPLYTEPTFVSRTPQYVPSSQSYDARLFTANACLLPAPSPLQVDRSPRLAVRVGPVSWSSPLISWSIRYVFPAVSCLAILCPDSRSVSSLLTDPTTLTAGTPQSSVLVNKAEMHG